MNDKKMNDNKKIDDFIFESSEINENINKNQDKIYRKNNNIIFSYIKESLITEKKEKYIVNIERNNEQYIGILTENFQKESFGYSLFEIGDEYIGEISNNKKHGFGIYKFKLNEKNEENVYIGSFADNIINGVGILINILRKEEVKNDSDIINFNLIKYKCYIGLFENGQFKTGKIYSVDNNVEKLDFQNDEDKELKEKNLFTIEKDNETILISKGLMKEGVLSEGIVININNNNEEVKNKFYFKKQNNSENEFEILNDNTKEKEIIEEFKLLNFKDYNKTINKIYSELINMILKIKKQFEYAKDNMNKEQFKNIFIKDFQIIINEYKL